VRNRPASTDFPVLLRLDHSCNRGRSLLIGPWEADDEPNRPQVLSEKSASTLPGR